MRVFSVIAAALIAGVVLVAVPVGFMKLMYATALPRPARDIPNAYFFPAYILPLGAAVALVRRRRAAASREGATSD